MFLLRINSAGHVWIRARFPKTREWSSDWTEFGMSEQEVLFCFCLRHFDTIANICSWVLSESCTACLDANKIQQIHSNKVKIKTRKNCIETFGCVLMWPFPAESAPVSELALHLYIMFGVRMDGELHKAAELEASSCCGSLEQLGAHTLLTLTIRGGLWRPGLMPSDLASMTFWKASTDHTGGVFKQSIRPNWFSDVGTK